MSKFLSGSLGSVPIDDVKFVDSEGSLGRYYIIAHIEQDGKASTVRLEKALTRDSLRKSMEKIIEQLPRQSNARLQSERKLKVDPELKAQAAEVTVSDEVASVEDSGEPVKE